jgi:hypothetical protein
VTNFESTSYHVEDQTGESVAFTVLPPSEDQTASGTGEHDPVLRLWSTQVMPDNRVINVEVGFSRDDVGGLQSYLNDQFGRGKAPAISRDDSNAEHFKSGWMSALKEVVLLARNDRNPIDWAVAQLEGQVVGDEAPMTETVHLDYVGPHIPYDPAADGVPVQPDYTPGPEVYARQDGFTARQCPAISNGVQCSAPTGHAHPHDFPGSAGDCFRTDEHHHMQDSTGIHWVHDGLELNCPLPDNHHPVNVWHPAPQNEDGAATPPAAPTSTPVTPGGEQAAASATGAANTETAPSSAPAEKKRTRRTKLEMAYDRALEALQSIPQGGAAWDAATHAMNEAKQALQDKDPGNSRLSQVIVNQQPLGNVQVAYIPPAPEQPPVQFAGEPVNPFTLPAPTLQPQAEMAQGSYFPGASPIISTGGVSPAESQAAQGFPCPQMDSSGTRQCVRPYGHELMTATNPEPKPHVFATDPGAFGGPLQPAQQTPQIDPVEAFVPMPAQPQQPAFSVTTPALTGMTDGGAQILSFQTPPTPADPTAFQIQGANLQPPAPAAPFLQPTPNGGQ